jgi:small subunit ribosomal protein S14
MKLTIPGLPQLVGASRGIYKDQLRRLLVQQYDADRTLYKALVNDQSLPIALRQQVQRLYDTDLPRDSSSVRVRNRCAVTGRPRGVYTFCGLSRHMFRKLASFGLLNGIKKASW